MPSWPTHSNSATSAQRANTCAASSRRPADQETLRVIYGIGTDICDIRRIAATFERQGERFAHRVLGDAEFAIWQARSARWPKRGLRYLATRFSAKEAFS